MSKGAYGGSLGGRWISALRALGFLGWMAAGGPELVEARDFRVNQIPNGTVFMCANCHINPAGGGARNAFGNRVFQLVGTSNRPFWTPALAAEDSDRDSHCNGEELGDPDGDGLPAPGAPVTNPGVSTSRPANAPPRLTGLSSSMAVLCQPFTATAAATDANPCQRLTFSKVDGPAWLAVGTNGVVSGTPPEGASGTYTLVLRVTDNGSPPQSAELSVPLLVVARYSGWQAQYFSLPQEATLAAPEADPDGDGLSNAAEYALRTHPRQPNAPPWSPPVFDAQGRLTRTVPLRDDDPTLSARVELSESLSFLQITEAEVAVTDPNPGDGLKLWRFTDPVPRTSAAARFSRLRVLFEP